jgi:hypothetical protein
MTATKRTRKVIKFIKINEVFTSSVTESSRAKRNRSNWQQRNILERVFQSTPYPDLSTRNELAASLGNSVGKKSNKLQV